MPSKPWLTKYWQMNISEWLNSSKLYFPTSRQGDGLLWAVGWTGSAVTWLMISMKEIFIFKKWFSRLWVLNSENISPGFFLLYPLFHAMKSNPHPTLKYLLIRNGQLVTLKALRFVLVFSRILAWFFHLKFLVIGRKGSIIVIPPWLVLEE